MHERTQKLDAFDLLFLMLQAADDRERISGRTTIQKIGYFACNAFGVENDYVAHFYGPYSPSIARVLKRMVSLRLVKEEPTVTNNDHVMYEYSLTPLGRGYASKISKVHKDKVAKLENIVETVASIEGDMIDTISKAAKVHYLKKHSPKPLSIAEIISNAKNLGWSLDQAEVKESLALIKEI